jgi:hypothetical protein
MAQSRDELLARHYRQLRETRGTVLLLPASFEADTEVEPDWFVDGCPLSPEAAVAAIRVRHGFGSVDEALAALRAARQALRAQGHPDAAVLPD